MQKPRANGRVLLNTPVIECEHTGTGASCMGSEDNLVISCSDDHKLYIWCLPNGNRDHYQTVNQPLLALEGHEDVIRSVRYSDNKSALISCDDGGGGRLAVVAKE